MSSLRLYHIVKTLLHFGLDDVIPDKYMPWYAKAARNSLFWLNNKHKNLPEAERFRLAIEALGPVFVKFGQMLSTRRDLLPDDFANELTLLQDKVPAFSGEQAKAIINQALGVDIVEQHIKDFDYTPLASASIAQVHTATLVTDDAEHQIVLKVLRPDIEKTITADIALMMLLAKVAARWLPDGDRLRPIEVVKEYKKTIFDELDLNKEARNAIQLKENFSQGNASDNIIYVPQVYQQFSCHNVMVMERIYGVGIGEVDYLHQQNVNMKLLAERGVEVFFTQVFRDSFFHADMHPGNVFVDITEPNNPTWIAIDCGICGTLNSEDKRYLAENFVAFFNSDYRKVAQLHVDSGWVPSDTNVNDFELAIKAVCEPIFKKPLSEISFGQVLVNLFNTARQFNMQVQPQLVLLQKTLLYIEGLGRQLYPQLDLWQTAKPFLENWLKEQMGIKTMLKKVKDNLPYWSEKLPEMPDLLYDYLKNNRQLQQQQLALLEKMQQQQAKQHKQTCQLIIVVTLVVIACLYII